MTAEQERAAIVAYLRKMQQAALERQIPQHWSDPRTWQARVLGRHDAFEISAEAISRGDHHKEGR